MICSMAGRKLEGASYDFGMDFGLGAKTGKAVYRGQRDPEHVDWFCHQRGFDHNRCSAR